MNSIYEMYFTWNLHIALSHRPRSHQERSCMQSSQIQSRNSVWCIKWWSGESLHLLLLIWGRVHSGSRLSGVFKLSGVLEARWSDLCEPSCTQVISGKQTKLTVFEWRKMRILKIWLFRPEVLVTSCGHNQRRHPGVYVLFVCLFIIHTLILGVRDRLTSRFAATYQVWVWASECAWGRWIQDKEKKRLNMIHCGDSVTKWL